MALDEKQIAAIEAATGHSLYGGSSLPRIVECPASVGEGLKAGLKPASVYAQKGTELHKVTEKALLSKDPVKYVYDRSDLTVEDTSYVLDAVEYVHKILALHPPGTGLKVEIEGNLGSYGIPESYGTMDVVIESALRTDVIDHKFGHGVAVYAKDNYQLVSYLGMVVPYTEVPDPDHKLYVHINQPTLDIYDEWRVDWQTLNQMILGDIADAVMLSRSDDPPYNPSVKACRFCNANTICTVRRKSLNSQAALISQMARNPSVATNEQWGSFLANAEALKTAIKQIEKYAVSEIQRGNEFPGFKLVAGRSNRKFIDEEAAHKLMEKRLGSKAFKEAEYISLSQAERIDRTLKSDEEWNGLLYKPQGKPKLVPDSAKGDPLVYGVSHLLNDVARKDS